MFGTKTSMFEIGLALVAGYYIMNRMKSEENEDFKRLIMGAGVGTLTAIKGPELYNYLKDWYVNMDESTKKKLMTGALSGTAGYALGDKIVEFISSRNEKTPKKTKEIGNG
jgi:hypothetical protein